MHSHIHEHQRAPRVGLLVLVISAFVALALSFLMPLTVSAQSLVTPTASASATPTTVDTGGSVTLNGTAAAASGGALTYAWTSNRGGSFADSSKHLSLIHISEPTRPY